MELDSQSVAGGEAFLGLVLRLRAKGINSSELFAALEQTPRQRFVDPAYADLALDNCELPLACGEYIERLDEQMALIAALGLEKKHRVLEIGTGSGYTAALMARLAGRVTTVERYRTLCDEARRHFQALELGNIVLRQMDATQGLTGSGPFDRIVIWPACESEPQAFIDMLAGKGILIAPVGPGDGVQTMMRYEKNGSRFGRTDMFCVRYQPFLEGVAAIL